MEGCEPMSCGNVTNISYHSWLVDEQPPYCGHPLFELRCTEDKPVLLHLFHKEYLVTRKALNLNSWSIGESSLKAVTSMNLLSMAVKMPPSWIEVVTVAMVVSIRRHLTGVLEGKKPKSFVVTVVVTSMGYPWTRVEKRKSFLATVAGLRMEVP
ncbi:LEAF RUST 10 DISEASE-RESISTANCE LOCUS RECEPTOR-LIKE PROTEIN KINASE-like [Canna indica]|uniref:LEAF RUST 10 DISEASE-RESISTANCE LOCUS RECEPTOR-LIKE PROTEIN KINASE-like n=1 Tax=Canna indica TaxID=4628 RepID=A0AAQ3K6H8_9LILI|nr:LEAF RUST 10 DISEASE-RESISTANCE LOCUS RECEPTOR-LIKE PROTEIN KINASE-like [Canna indica]